MKDKTNILKEVSSWIIILVLAVLFSALINSQLIAMATVQETSMQDTLYAKHKLIVNRLAYKNKAPKSGDIIIFYKNREIGSFTKEYIYSIKNIFSFSKSEDEKRDRLVKRVIGTPGDVIDIMDGYVYKNGDRLDEPYAKGITVENVFILPVTVGDNQLFVLGDNREESSDSRHFGLIDVSHVEGKVTLRIFPFNKFGKLD